MIECFTCKHKNATPLTPEESQKKYDDLYKKGIRLIAKPTHVYTCGVSGATISQTDPACPEYSEDSILASVRRDLSDFAKKMLKSFKHNSDE